MDNPLDFIGSAEPITADLTPAPEPVATEPVAQPELQDDRPRDAQGRFAPVQEAAAEPAAPPAGHVPVGALQEERAKRQALEEMLRSYAQPAQPPQEEFVDPYAFTQNAVLNAKLDMSEDLARTKHGDEAVNSTLEWFKAKAAQSPAFQQEVLTQRNPYEYAVQAYRRDKLLSGVTDTDLAEFEKWKAQKTAPAPANPLAAQPQSPPVVAPPQSLASAPSAAGAAHIPAGPGLAYDGLFKR